VRPKPSAESICSQRDRALNGASGAVPVAVFCPELVGRVNIAEVLLAARLGAGSAGRRDAINSMLRPGYRWMVQRMPVSHPMSARVAVAEATVTVNVGQRGNIPPVTTTSW
jgi:hypothetical protein